jgi:hypothetical protein
MPTIGTTTRPAYVYDFETDTWIPVGTGPHTHPVTDVTGAVAATLIDAKGDLIAGTADDTAARLPVGANGQAVVADSTAATGLKYSSNAPSGGMALLSTTTLTGAGTITVSGLSNLSRITVIVGGASCTVASQYIQMILNGDASAYGVAGLLNSGGTLAQYATVGGGTIPVARQGNSAADSVTSIINFDGAFSSGMVQMNLGSTATGSGFEAYNWSGFYISKAQITSVTLFSSGGNFDSGTMYIYGA